MTYLLAILALLGWGSALCIYLLLSSEYKRHASQSAQLLRKHVEPYLLRRASGIEGVHFNQTQPTQPPDEVVHELCEMARQLTDREKKQFGLGDTQQMATAETMPIDARKID
jgi:hypothetical protein